MSYKKISYEEKLRRNRIENLPHGKAMVKGKKGKWAEPDSGAPIYVYTGYLEPKGGWLHIYEDNGKVFSIPRERTIIEWDEKWRLNK